MFARWIRKTIGGIRLFLTLLVIVAGALVVAADMAFGVKLSVQAYGFLGAMLAQVAIFVWKDSARPTDGPTLSREFKDIEKKPAKAGFVYEKEGDPEQCEE